jgi:glucan phosphoethanolaminetransferase (alkaline phosphatase superfamily)
VSADILPRNQGEYTHRGSPKRRSCRPEVCVVGVIAWLQQLEFPSYPAVAHNGVWREFNQVEGDRRSRVIVEKSTEWLILISVVVVVAVAYILAWRGKRLAIRRTASVVVAAICTVAALVATMGYGIPALQDLFDTKGPVRDAVIANIIIWIICLGAWVTALRFAFFAVRNRPFQPRG